MGSVLFRDARIFDGWSETLREGCDVLVADGVIQEISDGRLAYGGEAEVVECAGRTLMPGLIDAHVHVYAASVNLLKVVRWPQTYTAHYAAVFLKASLDRGFTTVRDVGGGEVGLANALRDGLLVGPRLFYGGRLIGQTGGHGDHRPGDSELDYGGCGCACYANPLAVVADGVDEVRKAVREELRRGASHIKIMGSGGVASPTDPIDKCQYSDEEISAIVDDVTRAGKYVAAHCHPAEAVRRSVALGVRSIEHATLIDAETAAFVAEKGAFTVPTMAVIFALLEEGEKFGLPPVSMDKLRTVSDHALSGLEIMKQAGVKMGFGTDLIGQIYTRQSSEFELRARVLPTIDILRSVCAVNAELLCEDGRLGCVREGALADLLVVDGDPLKDISLLGDAGAHLAVVMNAGNIHKRTI